MSSVYSTFGFPPLLHHKTLFQELFDSDSITKTSRGSKKTSRGSKNTKRSKKTSRGSKKTKRSKKTSDGHASENIFGVSLNNAPVRNAKYNSILTQL